MQGLIGPDGPPGPSGGEGPKGNDGPRGAKGDPGGSPVSLGNPSNGLAIAGGTLTFAAATAASPGAMTAHQSDDLATATSDANVNTLLRRDASGGCAVNALTATTTTTNSATFTGSMSATTMSVTGAVNADALAVTGTLTTGNTTVSRRIANNATDVSTGRCAGGFMTNTGTLQLNPNDPLTFNIGGTSFRTTVTTDSLQPSQSGYYVVVLNIVAANDTTWEVTVNSLPTTPPTIAFGNPVASLSAVVHLSTNDHVGVRVGPTVASIVNYANLCIFYIGQAV